MPYDLYPAVDENYDFAQVVRQALAESLELRNTVVPMTEVDRNNLTVAQKWNGRLIVNTTTNLVERWDEATATWVGSVDQTELKAYVDTTTPDVYQGTAGPPAGTNYKVGDIYCQYL